MGHNFPILDHDTQAIGRSLGVTRTAEVIVVNPKTWRMVYRGPLNDRVHYERQRTEADERYVRDVLDSLVAGEVPEYSERSGPGCIVNIAERDGSAISYSETIAPLLEEKCTACHVAGGIAPWAMSEYLMVKGSLMIREVLRTRRMLPWHLDPEVGEWQHDASLKSEERATLIAWTEAGAPRGEGPDPLLAIQPPTEEWPLGEPDLILEVPAFEVPANGIVDYQFPQVENTLGRDAWVVAATIVPGDGRAVHHVLMGTVDERRPEGGGDEEYIFENYIMGYAPGNESAHMPEGTGVFVSKDAWYTFQMHYTPYGRPALDAHPRGALLRGRGARSVFPPAGGAEPHHPYSRARRRARGVRVLRVRSRRRTAQSDAALALQVPQLQFRAHLPERRARNDPLGAELRLHWQRTCYLAEPKAVPAGTRIASHDLRQRRQQSR